MKEYNVSFFAPKDGSFVVDIHASAGTSPYVKFASLSGLLSFFASLGIHEQKLAEIETICSSLKPEHAYHEQMFLPDSVIDAIELLIQETGGMIEAPPVSNPHGLAKTAHV